MVVVCSSGNDGPAYETVSNAAPWMITVGASTTYRVFKAYVQLSNGQRLKGTRLSKPMSEGKFYPLIDAADAISANTSAEEGVVANTLFGLSINFWMASATRFLLGSLNGVLGPIKAYASELFQDEYQALALSTVSTA